MIFLATNSKGLARAQKREQRGWQVTTLLPGRQINCLARDPFDRRTVYAGTQEHGLLRSEDRGRTWHPLGAQDLVVKSLAPSPHEPGLLYAGTKPAAVFVSHDGGRGWSELQGFRRARRWYWFSPAEMPLQAYVQGLAVSPSDPHVVVAGVEAGAVVRSADGGQTWSGHCRGADRDCHSLTFHASDGDWIYQGGGGGPAVSRDGGRTWRHHTEGMDGSYCWACAADPERPEVWYVSAAPSFSLRHFAPQAHVDGQANAAIYRSSGGATWQKLNGGLPQPLDYMAYALLTDPAAPGHLYAGLANGDVWHSDDYGDTWRKLSFNLGGIHRNLIIL
jgi:photosystem II stability/assembly factor-like uncharacterized protein